MPYETETRLIDGRVLRVYKNIEPTLRDFWIKYSKLHKDKTCIVYEDQRWSFDEVLQKTLELATMFQDLYGVKKGDRVAICARNFPEYVYIFWACHLLGAITVLVNAYVDSCRISMIFPEKLFILM